MTEPGVFDLNFFASTWLNIKSTVSEQEYFKTDLPFLIWLPKCKLATFLWNTVYNLTELDDLNELDDQLKFASDIIGSKTIWIQQKIVYYIFFYSHFTKLITFEWVDDAGVLNWIQFKLDSKQYLWWCCQMLSINLGQVEVEIFFFYNCIKYFWRTSGCVSSTCLSRGRRPVGWTKINLSVRVDRQASLVVGFIQSCCIFIKNINT